MCPRPAPRTRLAKTQWVHHEPVVMNQWLPFEWVLATRFLREGLLQTLFIVSGVALGVSVIVFMSALLTGLQSSIFKTLLDYQAQIVISPPDEAPRILRRGEGTELATLVQPELLRLTMSCSDGISLPLASRMLGWRGRLRAGILVHLHLHAAADRRALDAHGETSPRAAQVAERQLFQTIEGLRSTIDALPSRTGTSGATQSRHCTSIT